jgi:uncharacterized protein YrrD
MDSVDEGNIKWRYQLINYGTDDQPDLKLHEVYFDVNTGKINGWTERPYQISGYENSEEIVEDLEMIFKAIRSNAVISLRDLEH